MIYYDRDRDFYYDRFRPGLIEVQVFERGGQFYRWDNPGFDRWVRDRWNDNRWGDRYDDRRWNGRYDDRRDDRYDNRRDNDARDDRHGGMTDVTTAAIIAATTGGMISGTIGAGRAGVHSIRLAPGGRGHEFPSC